MIGRSAVAAAAVEAGRASSNQNRLPRPGVLSTDSWPPISATKRWLIAKPNPVPS